VRRAQALPLLLLTVCAIGACGNDGESRGRERASTQTTVTKAAKPVVAPRHSKDGCAPVAAASPRPDGSLSKPRRAVNRRIRYVATLRTNCGKIRIKLDVKNFPRTARSFVKLARSGFYDGLSFSRIAKPGGNDFVIQGGDPQGGDPQAAGNGGPGYSIVERPPHDAHYPLGTVAMAKGGRDKAGTSGSQFFIVTGEGATLDPLYAILGRVIDGRDTVRRIAAVPTDPVTESPIDPVIIKKVKIRQSKR